MTDYCECGGIGPYRCDWCKQKAELTAAKGEIGKLRERWNKATDFGEKQLARREELIAKLATRDKNIADLKGFFDEAYKDAEYFESQLAAANIDVANLMKDFGNEHAKVEKLTTTVKFFADMGWEYARQALADTEDKR